MLLLSPQDWSSTLRICHRISPAQLSRVLNELVAPQASAEENGRRSRVLMGILRNHPQGRIQAQRLLRHYLEVLEPVRALRIAAQSLNLDRARLLAELVQDENTISQLIWVELMLGNLGLVSALADHLGRPLTAAEVDAGIEESICAAESVTDADFAYYRQFAQQHLGSTEVAERVIAEYHRHDLVEDWDWLETGSIVYERT